MNDKSTKIAKYVIFTLCLSYILCVGLNGDLISDNELTETNLIDSLPIMAKKRVIDNSLSIELLRKKQRVHTCSDINSIEMPILECEVPLEENVIEISSSSDVIEISSNTEVIDISSSSEVIELSSSSETKEESASENTIAKKTLQFHKVSLQNNKRRRDLSKNISQNHIKQNIFRSYDIHRVRVLIRKLADNYKTSWLFFSRLGASLYIKEQVLRMLCVHENRFKKELDSLNFYYANIIRDLLEYLENNTTQFVIHETKKCFLPKRKETLGDIWFRKGINVSFCQKSLSLLDLINDKIVFGFGDMLNQVLCIPDVYQDFVSIDTEILSMIKKEVFEYNKEDTNDPEKLDFKELQEKFAIIEYLYFSANEKTKLAELSLAKIRTENYYIENLTFLNSFGVYKQVYNLLVLFYRAAPNYSTKRKSYMTKNYKLINNRQIHRLLGKNTIVKQEYKKCELDVSFLNSIEPSLCVQTNKETSTNEVFTFGGMFSTKFIHTSHLKYTSEWDQWTVSPIVQTHCHAQFVNNSTHELKTVHLPFYIEEDKNNPKYVPIHTINGIIQHIKKIFDIESGPDCPGDVYPFKRKTDTGKWSLIPADDEQRKKTIQYFEAENYNVVFYYIKEGLIHDYFIFAQFNPPAQKGLNDSVLEDDTARIPLFLSPLMQ